MENELIIPTDQEIQEETAKITGGIRYGLLAHNRHPEYLEDFWAKARAFYKGGVHLLENPEIMKRVFPMHVGEQPEVYEMRKQLAHYTNHSGSIVNHLIGKLMGDPVRVQCDTELDDFYTSFLENTSSVEGAESSLDDLVGRVLLEAAQTQSGYALVEMPKNLGEEHKSLAEQTAAGALDAYVLEVKAESVVGWEVDKSGQYLWALLCFKDKKRETVFSSRSIVQETYWMYTPTEWIRWEVRYNEGEPPKPDTVIPPTEIGVHTFGKVPLVRLKFPDGLWVMSKLESLAREYFNKRNALSWAEFKALMPVLYEYLDPGMVPDMSGKNRAAPQGRSVAHMQQRKSGPGAGDRAEWVAPPDAPFVHALASCESIRDEMHRVIQQMALNSDNKGSQLRRSAESKEKDTDALDVVLGEYGKLARRFVIELLKLVEAGRQDTPREWTATGASKFDSSSTDSLLEEETILDAVELPSPSFKAERKKAIARKVLGDSVSEDKLKEIDAEIEQYYAEEGIRGDEEANSDATRESVRNGMDEDDDSGEGALEKALTSGKPKSQMLISTFGPTK